MKVISWNVNSVNVRRDQIKKLINQFFPDVICLQETKIENNSFPRAFFEDLGYQNFVNGIKSYNGVAILSKTKPREVFIHDFCKKKDGRHIEVDIDGFRIHSIYVPAGGDEPDPKKNEKFRHKMEFLKRFAQFTHKKKRDKSIFCGDFNVAPYEDDVWSHKQLKNVVSHTKIERDALLIALKSGKMKDVIREFIDPPNNIFTWWSYRSPNYKKNNRGRRLDHIWVSEKIIGMVSLVKILDEYRSEKRPSDHVPVMVEIG